MLYIGENLKALRKRRDLTQEEAAEMLGVSPQSVSKWERGDTYPDIALLPAMANLYKISVDALIGMDKINDAAARADVFRLGHEHLQNGDIGAAIEVFSEALKIFPNDESFMSELAFAMALDGDQTKLARAIELCERVLAARPSEKLRHTTRAALSFMYLKGGRREEAVQMAHNLPHIRESREKVLAEFEKNPGMDDVDAYLRFIILGERGEADAVDRGEQDVIMIDFGEDMLRLYEEFDLVGKIKALREEIGAPTAKNLPPVRIRDNIMLAQNRVRVRHLADYAVDEKFADAQTAADKIIEALRKIATKGR